mgnify:CR=1 FL=1
MDAKMLNGKVAIVSGASYGMGYSMAELFAKEGAKVVMTARGQEKLDTAVQQIREQGYDVTGVVADNKNLDDVKTVIQTAIDVYGDLDIVINNAAIGEQKMIDETDDEWLEHVYQTNVFGPFRFIREALKIFIPKNEGCIINISSVGGLVPDISQVAYGTSKAAINYLTKLIAVQEAKHHIRCNAVLPGMTATEAVENHLSDNFRNLFLRHIPLGRMGLPEEIAEAVCYFASDASAYTTGQILTVSGGFGLATPVYGDLTNRNIRR